MKKKQIKKTKLHSLFPVKIILVISLVCVLVLQKSTPSSAISILRVEPSVLELQNQAFYNLRRGNFLEVFKKCEELLIIDKKSILAYELLAVSYAGIGNFEKAQELVEALDNVSRNSSLFHLSKGIILHSQQKFDGAIDECRKSIALDKENTLALYTIGRIYTDKKEFNKADDYLRKAIDAEPEFALAYTGLGINYLLQGKVEESFINYKKALEIDQDEHMARMGLATIFIGLKSYDNAIEQFKLVIKKIPDFIRARQNLVALYLQLNRFRDAIEQSNEILKINPDTAAVYLILARSYSFLDDFDNAIKSIKKYIDLQESSFEGNYLLGILLMANGDIESSKNILEKARKIDSENSNIMIASSLIYHIEGNYNKAEVLLKKARDLSPELHYPMINIFMTNLYLTQGKYKSSQKSLKLSGNFISGFRSENLDLKPDDKNKQSFVNSNLAIFFYLNRWYDKAIKMCDTALEIDPGNPVTLYIKGKSFIDKKIFNQGLSELKKIVEIQPDFISPHYDLARLYLIMDETDKALEEYRILTELDSKNASVHLSIGHIYTREEKYDEALAEYKQVINLAPDSPVGYNELAYHYAESETNLDEGLELALKAAKLAQQDASIIDTLGWIYFKKEIYDKAIEKLKSAVELQPDSPTIRFHLGMAYYKDNDLTNALTEFKNSLAISGRFKEASTSKEMIKLIENQLHQTK